MKLATKCFLLMSLTFLLLFLSACRAGSGNGLTGGGGGGNNSGGGGNNTGGGGNNGGPFTIGGTVLGLTGSGLVLELNGGNDLPITAGTGGAAVPFTFSNSVTGNYTVIVKTQPSGQTCGVTNGFGNATANVTNVQIVCAPVFTVGGTVTGLLGSGLTLQDNGGDNLTVGGTGTVTFTFGTPLLSGKSYAVTILKQPTSPGQTCVLFNASGTISGNVNNVQISCPQPKFSISGTVSGLVVGSGDTMELQDNAGDNLFVTGDVPFTFPTQFSYGTIYSVSMFLSPTSQLQSCNIFNATAVVTGLIFNVLVDCQHNDWAWMFPGPTPAINQYGAASLPTYTVGGPIPVPPFTTGNSNTPGGRDFAMTWTDKQGNRWLFGGEGFEVAHSGSDHIPGLLNDMWVWPTSPSSGEDDGWWTPGGWIPANLPIVVDNSGNKTQYFADPTMIQFKDNGGNWGTKGTGVSCASGGACTTPSARWGGITWTDPMSGNLLMFGGQGFDAGGNFGLLNDVWEFDITSGPCSYDLTTGTGIFTKCQWIWQGGTNAINQPTTGTFPGGRWGPSSATDPSGNVWMFGGQGYDSSGNVGLLNDLWKYNGTTWTLISPATVVANQNGVYSTPGANVPGGRQTSVLWVDALGKIWLFGGFGLDSKGTSGGTGQIGSTLNDLWKYDPSTGLWTWVSGSNLADQNGVYGTQATSNVTTNAAATSVPGARWGATGWVNPDGDLFLFGGFGYGSNNVQPTGFLNDVWEYDQSSGDWIWWKGSTDVNQPSTYITSPINFFQLSYTVNAVGARRGTACWTPDALGYVYCFGGEGYDSSSGGPYGELNDVWRYLPFP